MASAKVLSPHSTNCRAPAEKIWLSSAHAVDSSGLSASSSDKPDVPLCRLRQ